MPGRPRSPGGGAEDELRAPTHWFRNVSASDRMCSRAALGLATGDFSGGDGACACAWPVAPPGDAVAVSSASGDVEKGNITGGEVEKGERGGEAFGEGFGEALAAVASDAAFPAAYAAPGVPGVGVGVVGGDNSGRNIPAAFSQ